MANTTIKLGTTQQGANQTISNFAIGDTITLDAESQGATWNVVQSNNVHTSGLGQYTTDGQGTNQFYVVGSTGGAVPNGGTGSSYVAVTTTLNVYKDPNNTNSLWLVVTIPNTATTPAATIAFDSTATVAEGSTVTLNYDGNLGNASFNSTGTGGSTNRFNPRTGNRTLAADGDGSFNATCNPVDLSVSNADGSWTGGFSIRSGSSAGTTLDTTQTGGVRIYKPVALGTISISESSRDDTDGSFVVQGNVSGAETINGYYPIEYRFRIDDAASETLCTTRGVPAPGTIVQSFSSTATCSLVGSYRDIPIEVQHRIIGTYNSTGGSGYTSPITIPTIAPKLTVTIVPPTNGEFFGNVTSFDIAIEGGQIGDLVRVIDDSTASIYEAYNTNTITNATSTTITIDDAVSVSNFPYNTTKTLRVQIKREIDEGGTGASGNAGTFNITRRYLAPDTDIGLLTSRAVDNSTTSRGISVSDNVTPGAVTEFRAVKESAPTVQVSTNVVTGSGSVNIPLTAQAPTQSGLTLGGGPYGSSGGTVYRIQSRVPTSEGGDGNWVNCSNSFTLRRRLPPPEAGTLSSVTWTQDNNTNSQYISNVTGNNNSYFSVTAPTNDNRVDYFLKTIVGPGPDPTNDPIWTQDYTSIYTYISGSSINLYIRIKSDNVVTEKQAAVGSLGYDTDDIATTPPIENPVTSFPYNVSISPTSKVTVDGQSNSYSLSGMYTTTTNQGPLSATVTFDYWLAATGTTTVISDQIINDTTSSTGTLTVNGSNIGFGTTVLDVIRREAYEGPPGTIIGYGPASTGVTTSLSKFRNPDTNITVTPAKTELEATGLGDSTLDVVISDSDNFTTFIIEEVDNASNSSGTITGNGTIVLQTSNLPANGETFDYKVRAKVTVANGGTDTYTDTGDTFSVLRYLPPKTDITATPAKFNITPTDTGLVIAISDSNSTTTTSLVQTSGTGTNFTAGFRLASTVTGNGNISILNSELPTEGDTITYKAQVKVSTANGGKNLYQDSFSLQSFNIGRLQDFTITDGANNTGRATNTDYDSTSITLNGISQDLGTPTPSTGTETVRVRDDSNPTGAAPSWVASSVNSGTFDNSDKTVEEGDTIEFRLTTSNNTVTTRTLRATFLNSGHIETWDLETGGGTGSGGGTGDGTGTGNYGLLVKNDSGNTLMNEDSRVSRLAATSSVTIAGGGGSTTITSSDQTAYSAFANLSTTVQGEWSVVVYISNSFGDEQAPRYTVSVGSGQFTITNNTPNSTSDPNAGQRRFTWYVFKNG